MVNPNRFYTYAYLREDRTPYYIGKGEGNRVYVRSKKCIKPPKDKSRIIFLKQNLTEEDAFKHEIYIIAVFGRIDSGTGILHNRTDGGEGASGAIRSLEFKEKLRKANKNKTNPNYGKSASKETREKMKISQSGEKNPNSYWWKITFSNQKSVVLCGLSTWASKNGYNVGNIHSIYKGIRKKHKDIIMVEKIK